MDRRDFVITGACLSLALAAQPAFAIAEKLGKPQLSEFEKLFHLDNIKIIRVEDYCWTWPNERGDAFKIFYMFKDASKVSKHTIEQIMLSDAHNRIGGQDHFDVMNWWDWAYRSYDRDIVNTVMKSQGWVKGWKGERAKRHTWYNPEQIEGFKKWAAPRLISANSQIAETWYDEVDCGMPYEEMMGTKKKEIVV